MVQWVSQESDCADCSRKTGEGCQLIDHISDAGRLGGWLRTHLAAVPPAATKSATLGEHLEPWSALAIHSHTQAWPWSSSSSSSTHARSHLQRMFMLRQRWPLAPRLSHAILPPHRQWQFPCRWCVVATPIRRSLCYRHRRFPGGLHSLLHDGNSS